MSSALAPLPLPEGIRARFVDNHRGLQVHVLEAGFEGGDRPALLLLHGFPELAYSWRKLMLPLAQAGFHVIAPDQRGYGRTTGWDAAYDGDLGSFRLSNLATDALGLLVALGLRSVAAVIGHDFGSPVAACCALARPDVFRAVALMSAPFAGPPLLAPAAAPGADLHAELAQLPRPRKHYQRYYATREADADMRFAPQGLHDFLRAYYHHKSADWRENRPFVLSARSAAEFAKLPDYYVMDLDKTMAETVAPQMPSAAQIAACAWLRDDELAVYAAEFARTGLQGALQWYRCATEGVNADLQLFAGRTIDVPACFIAGRSDWGAWQSPGALEAMQTSACTDMRGCHWVDGAGHWVQQEQPDEVLRLLLQFLRVA
ncbi:MAG: alpha/beta hydrolase [Burkholderiales bacterium]